MTNISNSREAKKLQIKKVEHASLKFASANPGIVFIYNDQRRGNKESAIFYETQEDGKVLFAEVCINHLGKYQAHVNLRFDTGNPLFKMKVNCKTFEDFYDWMVGAIMRIRVESDNFFRS